MRRILLTLVLFCLPCSLGAQRVEGRVVIQGAGTGAVGSLVFLGSGQDWTQSTVTAGDGGFALTALRPGTYRLRIQRVGANNFDSEPFTLAAGEVRRETVVVPPAAVTLEGIRVEAAPRCVARSAGGDALAQVWEEARKALFQMAYAAASEEWEYEYVTYERDLDREGREVIQDSTRSHWIRGGIPFASAPADSLARYGYVRASQPSVTFFAPDAEVLLSQSFLDSHCFRLREGRGREQGMIGLAFDPVRGRELPDVSGVLWLDRASAEVRHLDFGYTRVRVSDPEALGGRVEYVRLPNGAWIVQQWHLRWPTMAPIRFGRTPADLRFGPHLRIREVGGSVIQVRRAMNNEQ